MPSALLPSLMIAATSSLAVLVASQNLKLRKRCRSLEGTKYAMHNEMVRLSDYCLKLASRNRRLEEANDAEFEAPHGWPHPHTPGPFDNRP